MEALAGLSLACNVMQIVSFTHETVELFTKVYHKRTADPNLSQRVATIGNLGQSLESSLSRSANTLANSKNRSLNTQLPSLCEEVIRTAKDLQARLHPPASSKFEALKSTVKLKFGGELSKISELDSKLGKLELTLQTGLLVDIWNREDALRVQQQTGFNNLNQKVKTLIQEYAQGRIELQDFIRRDHAAAILDFSQNLQTNLKVEFDRTNRHVTEVVQSAERLRDRLRRRERLIRSISFPVRNARKSAIKTAHEKTFEWMYNAPDEDAQSKFRKWIASGDDDLIFWVQGKPGSGKSTLMKFLASDPRTMKLLNMNYTNPAIYSHFIWMADKAVDGTFRGMLCSLICQILESDRSGDIVDSALPSQSPFEFRQHPNDWEIDELQLMLQQMVELHPGFVLIFIDGLDELVRSEDKADLENFVKTRLGSTRNARFCISSRPQPEEKLILRGYPTIELQKLTINDLQVVADQSLSKYFSFAMSQISEKDRQRLVDFVVYKSDGVFLWVTLALTRIKRGVIACDTANQILSSLEDTPSELNDLYSKMWDRLEHEQKHHLKDATFVFECLLLWKDLSYELEPFRAFHLTTCRLASSASLLARLMEEREDFFISDEFLDLCLTSQRQVESHCAGLVEFIEIEESSPRNSTFRAIGQDDPRLLAVDFIHRSLRDFLLEDGKLLSDLSDKETVFAAVVKTAICDAMIPSKLRQAEYHSATGNAIYNDVDLGSASYPHIEVYQDYNISTWSSKSHRYLAMALKCCHQWMRESKKANSKDKIIHKLWNAEFRGNVKLLKQAFKANDLPNLLEELAIHCDELLPEINGSLLDHPLATYLIWQRWDQEGIGYYGYGPLELQDYLKTLEEADMKFAYPHTIAAVGHAIPQLLTMPEAVLTNDGPLGFQEKILLLRRLKLTPCRWVLGSALLIDDEGGCFGTECGVVLPSFDRGTLNECHEVIFRSNAATLLNRMVANMLNESCPYHPKPWNQQKRNELETLLSPKSQEMTEVLLVGHLNSAGDKTANSTIVFDPRELRHLCDGWPDIFDTHKMLFEEGRPRYFAPSRSQSIAIMEQLDPILLMRSCAGPYDMCYCQGCTNEHILDVQREKLVRLKQARKDRVKAIKTIITEVCGGNHERIFDILGYLRLRGHYIPTESDVLNLLEAKSTLDKILVLERLNQEKLEMEKWMELPEADQST